VDGAANEALTAFLARMFDRPKRSISIVAGQSSRDKRVLIHGVTADAVAATLEGALQQHQP
jgi:uncharacterized protein YggU (UPF0235/DUF167 family)